MFIDDEFSLNKMSITDIQNDNLLKTLKYLLKNSAFYKNKFNGFDISRIKSLEDISRLPFTTKDELADSTLDFLCVLNEKIVEITTTSGTTGRPLISKMTKNDLDRLAHNEFLSFSAAGLSSSDVVIVAVTIDKCFIAGLAYYLGLNRVGASALRIGATSPEMLLNMAKATGATAIVGVPSYISRVHDYAMESGFKLGDLKINKIICIGEALRNADFSLNPIGEKLYKRWNCELLSTYGITELQSSFCECSESAGGHIHPEMLHVEIIDEDGNRVANGVTGEVVATTFGIEGMPVLRFKTGDISFLIEDECNCGLSTARLGPILGRQNQKLKLKGTSVYPQAIINVLESIGFIKDYVFIASGSPDGSEKVEIKVSLSGGFTDRMKKIKEKLKGNIKVTPDVTTADLQEIDRIKSSVSNRKKCKFVDNRSVVVKKLL